MVHDAWTITVAGGTALLTVRPFGPVTDTDHAAIAAERDRLLDFITANDADRQVRMHTPC